MMFIQFIAAVALVATATATQVPLVNKMLNLEATAQTQKAPAEHNEAASSTDFPSFKGVKDFPHMDTETKVVPEAFKNFAIFKVDQKKKTTTEGLSPFVVIKEKKSKRQNNLPAVAKPYPAESPFVTMHDKNEPSGIPAAFLQKKVAPNLSESGIPAAFLQTKTEPKLSESGIPLAFLEMKPESNFEKVTLAQPKCKITIHIYLFACALVSDHFFLFASAFSQLYAPEKWRM